MTNPTKLIGLFFLLSSFTIHANDLSTINEYPMLTAIEANGGVLSKSTKKWMKKWRDMNLEDTNLFAFKELSGSSSINLKIQKIDAEDEKGYKSFGSFVTVNEAANPNVEIASFNLAAIVGADSFYRPTIRYELGTRAKEEFKNLLLATPIKGSMRNKNKENILIAIEKSEPLLGCVKAKKEDFSVALDSMIDTNWRGIVSINSKLPVVKFIQAGNAQPKTGDPITLKTGYTGDALQLAREFSIMLTIDVVFGQYDRLSGGNIVITKDENQIAHFYATDNGGAYVVDSIPNAKKTASMFNRYDKKTIQKLRELNAFLQDPSKGFLGYTDAEKFVIDLGLYFERSPKRYINALKDNLAILLTRVKESESRHGTGAYFE